MNLKDLSALIKNCNWVKVFYYLFAFSVILKVIADFYLGRQGIHEGFLYPYRKPLPFRPYPVSILYLEWLLAVSGSVLIAFNGKKRIGALLIFLSFVMSMSQMFQHQKVLFLVVSMVLSIEPINPKGSWSLWFLKCQLIIVYVSSALFKMNDAFLSGSDLKETLLYSSTLISFAPIQLLLVSLASAPIIQVLAILVVLAETLIPLLLLSYSFWGVVGVILLHGVLALFLSNVLPFSFLMMTLSLLFLVKIDNPKSSSIQFSH